MRILQVQNLASELDLLPGDLNVMITLGRMAGLATSIFVPDSSSSVEISSRPEGYSNKEERLRMQKRLEVGLMEYFYINGKDTIRYDEIADLCLSILEDTPHIP